MITPPTWIYQSVLIKTTFFKISDFQINWNLLLNVSQRAFFHAFSPHYNGFLRTNLNIGVNMSFLPPWMRASAAVSNTLWTSVEPWGTMRSISMADSMKWVSFRPTEDTLKASREKACFPTRNVYLKEKKIENSQESCSKALKSLIFNRHCIEQESTVHHLKMLVFSWSSEPLKRPPAFRSKIVLSFPRCVNTFSVSPTNYSKTEDRI